MLDFFRSVASTISSNSTSPDTSPPGTVDGGVGTPQPSTTNMEPTSPESSAGAGTVTTTRDMLQDRAGIIVLREDLDFYVIPPRADIQAPEMLEVKRAAGRALLTQNGIFSGLKRSEEAGTTEQHLIEMLTAGYGSLGVCLCFARTTAHALPLALASHFPILSFEITTT
jgi:hypothetical protein